MSLNQPPPVSHIHGPGYAPVPPQQQPPLPQREPSKINGTDSKRPPQQIRAGKVNGILLTIELIFEAGLLSLYFIVLSCCKDNSAIQCYRYFWHRWEHNINKEIGWIGFTWLRLGTTDRLFWMNALRSYKMLGITQLNEEMLAYQEGLCCMDLVG